MACKTSVVIPYYQEEPGILRGAVASAIAQESVADLEIIVVDDGSPAPAVDDLVDLDLPAHVSMKLIGQPNRGPGAARNRGLDAVSPDTTYVAFLDSDDRWIKSHLSNALHALEEGYDIYFSDFWWSRHGSSVFARHSFQLDRHVRMDPHRDVWRYVDDARPNLIGPLNCIFMPTVVYRFEKFQYKRFVEQFRAGEDRIFLLDLLAQSRRLVFSTQIECFSGHGVHISEGAGWGSSRCTWRLYHEIGWRKWLNTHLHMTSLEREENMRQIAAVRTSLPGAFLAELRRMRTFDDANALRFVIKDPVCLYGIALLVMAKIVRSVKQWHRNTAS